MVIIGFDPGLTNTGYAVLRKKNNEIYCKIKSSPTCV